MVDIDNNKLMGLLIIAERSLLLSQVYNKERRKQRKWMRIRIRKKYGIGAYYSIINDLSLTDKKDFRKYLRMNTLAAIPILLFCLNKNQKYMLPLFLYCTSGHYQKVLYNCFCFNVMEYRKRNNIFCTSEVLLCFTQKNNFCINSPRENSYHENSRPSSSPLENPPGKFPTRKFPPGRFPPISLIVSLHYFFT